LDSWGDLFALHCEVKVSARLLNDALDLRLRMADINESYGEGRKDTQKDGQKAEVFELVFFHGFTI
jgi:hypothetical protein